MEAFNRHYGAWAVVTGASSGIGEEFSRQLAALKFNLVLIARRQDRLQRLAQALTAAHAIQVETVCVDLSGADFLPQVAARTDALDVGLLINNAGFALTGKFLDHSLDDELSLLHVNCRAPMVLAHHFGRRFVKNHKGGIINVSSAASIMPLPFWAQYSASKIYLRYLSESLWFEMKEQGVDVLALCPGGTRTEFSQVAGIDMGGGEVAPLVRAALENLGKKVSLMPGAGNALAAFVSRFISRRRAVILGSRVIGERPGQ